jgi:hypothetical protein
LPAHQRGFGRDSDDVGVPGQADRGKDARISQSGDDDALAVHPYVQFSCPTGLLGGRGRARPATLKSTRASSRALPDSPRAVGQGGANSNTFYRRAVRFSVDRALGHTPDQ